MSKLDEKQQMRRDYEQLQREYKNMEQMRKAYSEESLGIIKRQREMIEKLQTDNEVGLPPHKQDVLCVSLDVSLSLTLCANLPACLNIGLEG